MAEPPLRDIGLMLATTQPPFSKDGWIFEFKWDGYRCLANKEQLLTREKKDASTWFPEILEALQSIRGSFIIDGEVCMLDERGLPDFEAMRGSARPRTRRRPVTFFAFDLLFRNGKDLRNLPLIKRKELLRKLLQKKHSTLKFVDYIEREGEHLYQVAVANGMEGVVAKRADSVYVGARSLDWRKAKPEGFHDGWKRPLTRRRR